MPAQRNKGTRYEKYHTKLDDRTWSSLTRHDEQERKENRLAWIKNSESLPDDCFADDVQDNDRSVYYSISSMEGRRLENE